MVQKIAQGASMQNKRTAKLRERADIIRKSVHKTGDHLQEQTVHTTKLVQQALELMEAVSVFTLKNNEKDVVASDIEESVPDSNIETDNIIKTDIDTNNDIISDSGIDMDTSDITVNLDIKLDE